MSYILFLTRVRDIHIFTQNALARACFIVRLYNLYQQVMRTKCKSYQRKNIFSAIVSCCALKHSQHWSSLGKFVWRAPSTICPQPTNPSWPVSNSSSTDGDLSSSKSTKPWHGKLLRWGESAQPPVHSCQLWLMLTLLSCWWSSCKGRKLYNLKSWWYQWCNQRQARFPLFLVVIVDRGVTGTTVVFRQRQKNRFLGASLAFVAPGDIVGAHLGMSNIITACAKGVHASLSTLRNLSRQTSTQTSVTFFCSPHGF